MNRKIRILLALALVAMVLMSAQTPTRIKAADDKLEVFSWWTSGGEAAALQALFDTYKKMSPSTEIINATVAGGAGTAARLSSRLACKARIRPTPGSRTPVGN